MLRHILLTGALCLSLPFAVSADCNLALNVTPDTVVTAGSTVTIDVTGAAPTDYVFLVFGNTLGSTTVDIGGFVSVTLGLAQPFNLAFLGTGDAALAFTLPQVPPQLAGLTFHMQTFSLALSMGGGMPTVTACVSNMDLLSF
ncbi:MAG: hypothetical protein HY812_03515 [Planctomycetes bacterium]|nr:hypothetical protein [Planctomycetota bacterium]